MEPIVFVVMIAEAPRANIKGREIFGCLEKEDGSHLPPNVAQTKSTEIQDSLNKTTRKQDRRNYGQYIQYKCFLTSERRAEEWPQVTTEGLRLDLVTIPSNALDESCTREQRGYFLRVICQADIAA